MVVQPVAEEYALLLEVTMADQPRHPHPCPPVFSWNTGMCCPTHPEGRSQAERS